MTEVQVLVNGSINGLTIAVLALGFSVVYLPTRVFALALAGLYALSPYVVWQAREWGISWLGSVAIAMLSIIALSLSIERLNHRALMRRNAPSAVHMITSLGLFIVIIQVLIICWGNETRVLRSGIGAAWKCGSIVLVHSQLLAGCVSLAVLAAFYAWLRYTRLGLRFRALADNPIQLALNGVNTDHLRLLVAGMAGFLTAVSSILCAYDVGFDPHSGLGALLLAIVAVIVGGRSSFLAPILGGLLVGILRSEVVWHLSARWQEAVTFLLLVLILFLRPQGLLGTKERLEADS
jgi:branched-chain amino acid transport system permease protein